MIVFDLQCSNGHVFEGWFEDEKTFKNQQKNNRISCPVCSDVSVFKIPSTFAIKASQTTNDTSDQQVKLAQISEKIVDYVKKNFDNVGCDFTSEALKIHYGVSEPRNIRGVSSGEEEKLLKKEGVKFIKFPLPVPEDTDV